MGNVGLLYVGAVLLVNGLALLGRVSARSAAPLNLFVGGLQCVTPTVLIIQAGGDANAILAASGVYLFGITYLYVGIAGLAGLDPAGIGWFSLFVAGAAVVYSGISFWRNGDPVFGVIWLAWALLWALFFLVLGLGKQQFTTFTGWTVTLLSLPTCAVPAFLGMTGGMRSDTATGLLSAGIVIVLVALARLLSMKRVTEPVPA
ncbi:AmiS/UreI family transporter [Actinocrispum wychmicini]|uniref:AmiS/UreI family transporter n=1 Tax=Actinocrispum wychmicini TaxID=1213861 RepID=A0A4R2JP21_9PSEU|nr:AmiS/UreI family transporter [Actinocrispum wychmicini]TCO60737.1 AmiS/UreI family transporter [Actinocrispum wychmicini]